MVELELQEESWPKCFSMFLETGLRYTTIDVSGDLHRDREGPTSFRRVSWQSVFVIKKFAEYLLLRGGFMHRMIPVHR